VPGGASVDIAALAALVADQQRRESSVETALNELVSSAARQLPGADYAGITLASARDGISNVASTGAYPEMLDEIQQRHQDGPCVAAAWDHHMVYVEDVATEQRWPLYTRDVLANTPILSVLSFEVFVDGEAVGALNFYAERAHAFGADAKELGLIFATHAALAWQTSQRSAQFRSALASRDVIGQAKGMLIERFDIDAVAAFDLLARLSQESNVKLVDIAERLIAQRRRNGDSPHRD
jgi:transcriptional regulator with GAF, ATPase, and Fis domain